MLGFVPFLYFLLEQANSLSCSQNYFILFLQLIPILMDGLSVSSNDFSDKDILYNLLLVLSGILTDKNGQNNCTYCCMKISFFS